MTDFRLDFFNPGWEVEIGSSKGEITHRNIFRRKVDPIGKPIQFLKMNIANPL